MLKVRVRQIRHPTPESANMLNEKRVKLRLRLRQRKVQTDFLHAFCKFVVESFLRE